MNEEPFLGTSNGLNAVKDQATKVNLGKGNNKDTFGKF